MAKSKNEVAPVEDMNAVPAFLKEYEGETGLEGLDNSDFIIPRLKLLQGLSPEVRDFADVAKPGVFWCTSTGEPLGDKLTLVACTAKKRVLLMAPMGGGNDQSVLARSEDCIHWDKPNEKFNVKIKNVGTVEWSTGPNVPKSKLLEFGSSNPNDPNSAPAATLLYEYLVYVVERPDISPLVVSLYRTNIPTAKTLNTMLAATRKPMFASKLITQVDMEENDVGSWYSWKFRLGGYIQDQETFEHCKGLAERYREFRSEVEETGIDDTADDAANEQAF